MLPAGTLSKSGSCFLDLNTISLPREVSDKETFWKISQFGVDAYHHTYQPLIKNLLRGRREGTKPLKGKNTVGSQQARKPVSPFPM